MLNLFSEFETVVLKNKFVKLISNSFLITIKYIKSNKYTINVLYFFIHLFPKTNKTNIYYFH